MGVCVQHMASPLCKVEIGVVTFLATLFRFAHASTYAASHEKHDKDQIPAIPEILPIVSISA